MRSRRPNPLRSALTPERQARLSRAPSQTLARALAASAALLLGACDGGPDERPLTDEFLVTTVLAPTCRWAGCHSRARRAGDLALDTVENARRAFVSLVVPGQPGQSLLLQVLSGTNRPMPPESPLPLADIELVERWIAAGAPGAGR